MDLSIIVPARNEEWLNLTVQDLLEHTGERTEIIVLLDGAWPETPLPMHSRLNVVYLPKSIGQRAATNLGARLSTAKYIAKLDAHVSIAQDFDVELIRAAEELGPSCTQIPAQSNLHVYDQVCDRCAVRADQAPVLDACPKCRGPLRKDAVWKPRARPTTTNWVFDSELHFRYASNRGQVGDYPEIMSFLGACLFVDRQHFLDLGGFDERVGSWGQFGQEWACREWLSGGRVVVNRRTSFSHFFRVGGIGFPYPIHGSDQEKARQYCRDYWRGNKWSRQVRPLRWLVEKFWEVPGWSSAALASLPEALPHRSFLKQCDLPVAGKGIQVAAVSARESVGSIASTDVIESEAQKALLSLSDVWSRRQHVAANAVRLSGCDGRDAVTPHDVFVERDELNVRGIAAPFSVAEEMIQLQLAGAWGQGFDKPSVEQPVNVLSGSVEGNNTVGVSAAVLNSSSPKPATSSADFNATKDTREILAPDVGDREILGVSHASAPSADVRLGAGPCDQRGPTPPIVPRPSGGIVFYSDCRGDERILSAVRQQLRRVVNGHQIVSVTLAPLDFGQNIVLPLERGYLTMFRQILVGLEALSTDIAFLIEHDVLYGDHFAFTPPRTDTFYYNAHVWKVDAASGRALHYLCNQTSGLCASRVLLLEHYRARVARVERDGFTRRMGFEPGTRKILHGGIDDRPHATWMSAQPNIDIRHGQNLTASRWHRNQFRNQKFTAGWTEGSSVPGWPGLTLGRFDAFLEDLAHAP